MHWEALPDGQVVNNIYYMFPTNQGHYGADFYIGAGGPDTANVGGHENNNVHHYTRRSYYNNKVYYNPATTYKPWVDQDGNSFGNASTTCAPNNPFDSSKGCRNLTVLNNGDRNTSTDSYGRWRRRKGSGTYEWYVGKHKDAQTGADGFWPAVYFTFDTTNASCDGTTADRDCYDKIEVKTTTASYTKAATRTDCAGASCTYAEEVQNFANWYSYYRSRVLLARAGVGRAFASQGDSIRVGFGAINKAATTIDTFASPGTLISGLRSFTGADKTAFFNNLYGYAIPTASTPLRRALDDIGKYFEWNDDKGPWGQYPGTGGGDQLACRSSYHILMTDGYWNGSAANTTAAKANVDGNDGPTINAPDGTSYQYSPAFPYKDDWGDPDPSGGTLADVAMYYWYRDLHSSLDNEVPANSADPAFWQHLVTYTVGLGLSGTLNPAADLPALTAGTKTWPKPSGGAANLDDLWHAAVNSRGGFFSASDPDTFAQALSSTLTSIASRTSSAASAATNSSSLNTNSRVYQARFNTADWSGELRSFPIDSDGVISATPDWNAQTVLDLQSPGSRRILTFSRDSKDGMPFLWSHINGQSDTSQADWLNMAAPVIDPGDINPFDPDPSATDPYDVVGSTGGGASDGRGSERVDYLRGSSVTDFRVRTHKLGDIANSTPWFAGEPDAGYSEVDFPGYFAFRSTYLNRTPVIWVGGNDGMLHGFNACLPGVGTCTSNTGAFTDAGAELLAYVPGKMYDKLRLLTDTQYAHTYFVDGSSMVADVKLTNGWQSVLVGGLNGGGQGYYALDVTDPANFSETNAASIAMWEFTDEDDADLGYTYNQPGRNEYSGQPTQIAKMANGKWAAIVGNGYNNTFADGHASTSGHAALFIVFLDGPSGGTWTQGTHYVKIDTGVGDTATPNGLATPYPVDMDGDGDIDAVYAGDLRGNLWKFLVGDLAAGSVHHDAAVTGDPATWKVAFTGNPLFTAKDASNTAQPITSAPVVYREHGGQDIVLFGTGKYVENSDVGSVGTQTIYGILDGDADADGAADRVASRTQLVQQVLGSGTLTVGGADYDYRTSTSNGVTYPSDRGWYMDLSVTGERVAFSPVLRSGGQLFFFTVIPAGSGCEFGGTSWTLTMDPLTGAQPSANVFDLNQDGAVSNIETDAGGNAFPLVIGIKSSVGIHPTATFIRNPNGNADIMITSGSGGSSGGDPGGDDDECTDPTLCSGGVGGPANLHGRVSWQEIVD
jgi:type IV pilus assembly protein PilY1